MAEKELFLRYDFNKDETLDMAQKLARESTEKESLEDMKKAMMSDLKSKIDSCVAHINSLSTKITNGYEMRSVKCDIDYNNPKKGVKTITRLDIAKMWTENMTDDEIESLNL